MNFVVTKRRMIAAVVVGASLTAISGTASLTACGDSGSCTKVRDDMFAQKKVWAACDPNDPNDPAPCIKVFGNPRDCSGVLSCDFAVHRKYRLDAEQAVLTIANQTQGCYLCATPNCVTGDLATCEPISKQCIIVSQLLTPSDASATIDVAIPGLLPPPDAGSD
jgi:hypothetical protein